MKILKKIFINLYIWLKNMIFLNLQNLTQMIHSLTRISSSAPAQTPTQKNINKNKPRNLGLIQIRILSS